MEIPFIIRIGVGGNSVSPIPINLLLQGQSNALGTPELPVLAVYTPDPDVQFYHQGNNQLQELRQEDLETFGGGVAGSFNLGLSAAKRLHDVTGRPVNLIINARSGRRFTEGWLSPNTTLATREDNIMGIIGATDVIVMSQIGESYHDDVDGTQFLTDAAAYETLLATRSWYGGTIVRGELAPTGTKSARNPDINTLTHVVSSAGLTVHDGLHFDSASLVTLGERYADYIIGLNIL